MLVCSAASAEVVTGARELKLHALVNEARSAAGLGALSAWRKTGVGAVRHGGPVWVTQIVRD